MRVVDSVFFEKPDIAALKAEGFVCVDMHFHSKYSDGLSSVKSVAKRALRHGVGVSITDHNFILGSMELSKRKDVFSIPGIEVEAGEGYHLLFYFYDVDGLVHFYQDLVLPYKSRFNSRIALKVGTRHIVEHSSDYNAVMVAAHPYSAIWYGIAKDFHKMRVDGKLLRSFDAIEVISGETSRKRNLRALALASGLDAGITGGSDGHRLCELGGVLTCARAGSAEGFLDAVRKGRCLVVGRESRFARRFASNLVKVKMAPFYPFRHLKMGISYFSNRGGNNSLRKGIARLKEKASGIGRWR